MLEVESLSGSGAEPLVGFGAKPRGAPILDTPRCAHFSTRKRMSAIEQVHASGCRCWKCYANEMGRWIDSLSAETGPGRWQVFATVTYATKLPPWRKGFPLVAGKPKPDFAHHLFDRLILHLESELGSRVDYVVADEFGSINGRFHQHAILAAPGLDKYPRKEIWKWLKERAGWSRILPFKQGAAFYISRYIGRDTNRCEWAVRIGEERLSIEKPAIGKVILMLSAAVPREFFKNSRTDRKR